MEIVDIDNSNLEFALNLLATGFRDRSRDRSFFKAGIARAQQSDLGYPLGFLVKSDDEYVGVLLIFWSKVELQGQTLSQANLSSLYLTGKGGASLIWLLKKIQKTADVVVDLTATEDIKQLLLRMNFRVSNSGSNVHFLPFEILFSAFKYVLKRITHKSLRKIHDVRLEPSKLVIKKISRVKGRSVFGIGILLREGNLYSGFAVNSPRSIFRMMFRERILFLVVPYCTEDSTFILPIAKISKPELLVWKKSRRSDNALPLQMDLTKTELGMLDF